MLVTNTETNINDALFATISYFDIAEFPLTLLETHRWLWGHEADLTTIHRALEAHPHIHKTKGFYHLKNKHHHVAQRLARYSITEQKIRKLKPYLRWIATLPYVKALMLSDSMGIYNAREESDIDIFIITTPGKIWSTRFWAAMPAEVLKIRPQFHGVDAIDKKDKICLCCYTTDEHLNLEHERITKPDIDFIYWIATMYPIYDPHNTYTQFFHANRWVQSFIPNARPYESSHVRMIQPFGTSVIQNVFKTLSWESTLKKLQEKILNQNLRELANQPDSRVVISNDLLKLHLNDTRLQMQQEWERRMQELVTSNE